MAGTSRSGGRNKKSTTQSESDGKPTSPRVLSPRSKQLFAWLISKLGANGKKTSWRRVDGALIASLAEILESQERVASMLEAMPENLELIRLRSNLAGQVSRMSSLVGLCPLDRSRMPAELPVDGKEDAFQAIMRRMSSGN